MTYTLQSSYNAALVLQLAEGVFTFPVLQF